MNKSSRIQAIAVGASAGGVESLSTFVSGLDPNISAAIFVVMHFPQTSTSVLPHILERSGSLPAKHVTDGEIPRAGTVYIAPPGTHLLIREGRIHLSTGPKENGHRPAIDPLFRTIARCYGQHSMGILLSGLLDDGTIGMSCIKAAGGLTAVQDPEEALFADMPRNAINNVAIDHVLTLHGLAHLVNEVACLPVENAMQALACHQADGENDPTAMPMTELNDLDAEAKPSDFTCPECHGTLFERLENGIVHFRCRVGHAYSSETLASDQNEALEAALWAALRALDENVALMGRLRDRASRMGHELTARNYSERVHEGQERSELLHRFLVEWNGRPSMS